MFKHGVYGEYPRIPDGMLDSADPLLPEFFVNLGCPLALIADEAKAAEVHPVETAKDSMKAPL